MILFVSEMILVGIAEEGLFRGILQNTLQDYFGDDSMKGVYGAIILQGILYGAIYYRSNRNIWICIFIHAFQDMSVLLANGILGGTTEKAVIGSGGAGTVIGVILFVMVDMYVLRKDQIANKTLA